DITDLPSGNYRFCIRVIDKTKKPIIYACVPFQRSNPKAEKQFQNGTANEEDSSFVAHLTLDSLRYSLKAIAPIVDQTDIEYLNLVIEGRNENAQKTFLYNFWYSYNPLQPGKDYQDYMKIARVVDQQFRHGFGYGFESDRGFMYLRYGRPDQLVNVIDDPSAPPYEIWTYSRLEKTKQSNVKFIFYNPSLAEGMYVLLHSTARGELQNPNWQRLLYKNATNVLDGVDSNDPAKMKDNWNRNADRYFIDN
ncbi:MAG: GWxTD domain-containing protein, partial [Saprospiraceae bacterium]